MSVITPEGLESSLTSEDRIEQAIDSLVDAIEAPESAVSPFIELVEDMAHQVDETAQDAAQARERAREAEAKAEELEAELKEERETRAKEAAQDRKRLHEVKERVDSVEEGGSPDSNDETPTPEAGDTALHKPETPLEDIIRVPEHSVQEHLRANHQRARFIAKDIHEYSRSVPAGRAIKSSELRRVLSASEGGAIHTQTVSRVIERLDDLGKQSVKVRETQEGERVVVFTDKFVKRVVAFHNSNHSVVAHEEVKG